MKVYSIFLTMKHQRRANVNLITRNMLSKNVGCQIIQANAFVVDIFSYFAINSFYLF